MTKYGINKTQKTILINLGILGLLIILAQMLQQNTFDFVSASRQWKLENTSCSKGQCFNLHMNCRGASQTVNVAVNDSYTGQNKANVLLLSENFYSDEPLNNQEKQAFLERGYTTIELDLGSAGDLTGCHADIFDYLDKTLLKQDIALCAVLEGKAADLITNSLADENVSDMFDLLIIKSGAIQDYGPRVSFDFGRTDLALVNYSENEAMLKFADSIKSPKTLINTIQDGEVDRLEESRKVRELLVRNCMVSP